MSTHFVSRVRIAGAAAEVARFHAEVLKDEKTRPSLSFEAKVLATDAAGQPVAMQYVAGLSRYHPAIAVFAKSRDAAAIDVVTEVSTFYENAGQDAGVYRGTQRLLKTDTDDDLPKGCTAGEQATAAFTQAAAAGFGIQLQL